jgi:SAM-dependent methyltransferase
MTTPPADAHIDIPAFDAFEASGWEHQAPGYDAFFTGVTRRTVGALLDAARVGHGTRLLDVGTGPGHVAGAAAARGAAAVGVDISGAMVALARKRWPGVDFQRADAQRLPFPGASFDTATGNFAILHLGRPERAVGELERVVSPGGTVALTVWDEPERATLFGAVLEAVDACGAAPPGDVPAGPAFFRFSTDDAFRALLEDNGLAAASVATLTFTHRVRDVDELWHGILRGSVRTAALIAGQPAAVQHRIRDALATILERNRRGGALEIPVSVKLATASVPASRRASRPSPR